MSVDKNKLVEIVRATATGAAVYVSQAQGQPMVAAGLIEVNGASLNPSNPSEVQCRATPAAEVYLKSNGSADAAKPASNYAVMNNVALPAAKRRGNPAGNGAPAKYPFESMEVNAVFFSGNSEHKKGDAVKALGSTISAQNKKYSTETGEFKTVTRAVRDKQTHKALLNEDGSKLTETVQLPVLSYERKFTVRPVEKGYQSGDWVAPEDGALVGRIK